VITEKTFVTPKHNPKSKSGLPECPNSNICPFKLSCKIHSRLASYNTQNRIAKLRKMKLVRQVVSVVIGRNNFLLLQQNASLTWCKY